MAYYTFYGGLLLEDQKKQTREKEILQVFPGKELVYPLRQHQGQPAIPVVSAGEYIRIGQLLAKPGEGISAPVHASVSGIVKGIEECLTADGIQKCILVENDELYKEIEFRDYVDTEELSLEEIIESIEQAGVVGMGGAGYPTAEKIKIAHPEQIKYIIANCTECEPYLTSGYRAIVEHPEWIVEGLRILLKLFPKAKGIFAIEDDKQEAITALQMVAADTRNMKTIPVRSKYPQGAERMLIYACTGRKFHAGQVPADIGCLVINSDTLYAICNGVCFGRPLTKRLITYAGDCVKESQNLEVFLGTSFADVVKAMGGFQKDPKAVICGGLMTGTLLKDLRVPITKTSSALLSFEKYPAGLEKASDCINCGRCVEVCNEQLIPAKLAGFASKAKKEKFQAYGGMECCECGSCSYICPAKRPLTEIIKNMKHQIQNEEKR